MTANPRTPRARRLSIRAKLEIFGAVALAIAVLGVGWINLDRAPDTPDTKPEIATNTMPAAKPRAGPRIVQRPPSAATLPASPKPGLTARNDSSAAKPPPPPDVIAPVDETAPLAGVRRARLASASRDATERGDPVTGALIALEALPGTLDGPIA